MASPQRQNKRRDTLKRPQVSPTLVSHNTARAQKRKYASQMSLTRVPPSDEEREIIHKLFLDTQKESNPLPPLTSFMENKTLPPDYVYISSTKYQSTIIMQPQKKNIHNKVGHGVETQMLDFWRVSYEESI